jgi:hypothetical protein
MKQFTRQLLVAVLFIFSFHLASAQPGITVASEKEPPQTSIDSLQNIDQSSVILGTYKAYKSAKTQVTVNWTTTKEENNDFFRLERSQNGTDFSTIAIIRGVNKENNYTQIDEQPLATDNYYRLSQTDKDGKTTVYAILKVRLNGIQGSITISPNPAKDQLQLSIASDEKGMVTASVFNTRGVLMKQWMLNKQDQQLQQSFSITDLQPGTYILQLKINAYSETQQFVKN